MTTLAAGRFRDTRTGDRNQMSWFGGHWGPVLVAAVIATVVAGAGGAASTIGPWYRGLRKPSWQPPTWLFGPVWTLIFALIAGAGVIGWEAAPSMASETFLLVLFAVNAVFNLAWSVLFFTMRRPDWALIDIAPLWLTILALVVTTAQFAGTAALLLMPYLLWVTFAGYLNLVIVRLNAPFTATAQAE